MTLQITSDETPAAVHSRVLERIAAGAPLSETLDALVRVVESVSAEGLIASILLVDEDGRHLRHGSAPSLPDEYSHAIDGIEIGPSAGSCGTAAYRAETVLVSDVAGDPLWAGFRDLALRFDLRACWSTPIFGSDGAVIGTFANYYRTTRDANPLDQELTRLVTRTAAIAIEHERRRLRLDREMRRLQRIYNLTDMLGRARSLDEIYEEAMSAVQDLLGVRRVSILLFDDDRVMRFKAWRGLSDDYRRAVEGHTPWSPEDVDAVPIVVPDVFADPELSAYADVFRREGISGLGFMPLRTRGVLGKFMAYFDEPRALSPDELRVAETIAQHMAVAVERAQREQKLQRTNAIIGAVFDQTSDAVFVKDREGRYVMVNAAAARVAGLAPSQMLDRTAREVFPEPTAAGIMQRDTELMNSGVTRSLEEPIRTGNDVRTFLSTKGPWRDGDGNVIGLIGISRDITERKRAEEELSRRAKQQAALAEFGALAVSEAEVDSVIGRAAAMALEGIGGDAAELRELDAPTKRIGVGGDIDETIAVQMASLAVAGAPAAATATFEGASFRRGISVVVRGAAGRPFATLSVVCRTAADYSADDAHFMQSLAGVLGMTVERHAIAEASRQSEERFRSLSACSPTGIFLTDVQGLCRYTNASCQEICGFTSDEAFGAGWSAFVHPDDREAVFHSWTRSAISGAAFDQPFRWQHQDGSVRWARVRTAPVRGDRGQLIGHVGTVEDITSMREMTEALRGSEERYRSLVNATAQIVWTADAQGLIDDMPHWRQITGQTREEVRGTAWADAIHPDDRAATLAAVRRGIASGEPHEIECRLRLADGTYRYHVVRAVPVRNADGSIREWVGTCTDIDDRRRGIAGIELLSEASAVLGSSLVLDQTLGAVARLVVNRGAALCSIVLADGESLTVRELAHRDAAVEPRLRETLATSNGLAGPLRRVIADGNAVLLSDDVLAPVEMRSALLLPLEVRSRILGALVIASHEAGRYGTRDLTVAEELAGRVALAIDNATLYAEAQAASSAKDEFLATLSHELRTPMTAILGWTRLLQLGDLDPDSLRVALESIDSSTRAQAQIVEDILDVSRIITGKMALEPQPIQLDPILRAAVDAIRPAAAAKHITVEVTSSGSRAKIVGDPHRLRQVVWNLLSNAIKFTPKGGRVQVSIGSSAEETTLTVADSGEGIAPSLLPHIFERFRQGDSSSTRVHGGLGLGLAIVRHLVELHGGSVQAESDGTGKGAKFTVRLPSGPRQRRTGMVPRRRRDNAPPQLPSLRRKRVLVVDDEEQTRSFLSALLLQCGAEVRASASAAEALSVTESWRPHVVVSDLAMPQEDGYSLIARLRVAGDRRRRPRIAAIALTAYGRPEDRDRALAAGFDRFLQKPIEPLELAQEIAAATKPQRRA